MGTVVPLRAQLSDHVRDLHERFCAGDPDAFDAVVEPHLDALYTFCLRVTRRPEDAHDLAHDTLVRARTKCDRFEPGRPARPWLLAIAHNLWRSRNRSPWVRMRELFASWSEPAAPLRQQPDRAAEQLDVDGKVRRALAELPPMYREAIALFHLQDMTYVEISQITGVSVSALKQRVRRGSQLLADRVAEMYPELTPERISRGALDEE